MHYKNNKQKIVHASAYIEHTMNEVDTTATKN